MRKIGTLTSGIVLLGVGIVLTIDTLFHRHWFAKIAPLWPLVLVAIGLEVLWAVYFNYRFSRAERVRIDFRSISLLTIAAVIAFVFTTSEKVVSRYQENKDSSVATQILNSLRDRSFDLPDIQFPLQKGTHLHIRNWRGSIVVTGSDQDQVTIKTVVHAILPQSADTDASRKKLSDLAKPTVTGTEDKQIVVPSEVDSEPTQITRVDLTLTVPKKSSLLVEGRIGNLSVTNVSGDVSFFSDAGNIAGDSINGSVSVKQNVGQTEISKVIGNVDVSANSGTITLSQISGSVKATSDLGDVNLHEIHGKTAITCKSGYIQGDSLYQQSVLSSGLGAIQLSQVFAGVTATTEEGSITVDCANLGDLNLHSDKGVVSMRIPSTASFRFDGSSNRGVVKGPLSTALSSPTGAHVQETVNGGTYQVTVTTGDGAIMVTMK